MATDWTQVRDITISAAAGISAMAIIIVQVRAALRKEKLDSISILEKDVHTLKGQLEQTQNQLTQEVKLKEHLMKQVDDLTAQNKELRQYIMLERVPEPLKQFVVGIGDKNYEAILSSTQEIKDAITTCMNDLPDVIAGSIREALKREPKRATDP